MTSVNEIAGKVQHLGHAWEQFKTVNDQRLREIEKKGSADPLYDVQLQKINDALDATKGQLNRLEGSVYRPEAGKAHGGFENPAVREYKSAFCGYIRKGEDAGLAALEQKALSVGSDPEGGYLVTPTMSDYLAKTVLEVSPIRQLARIETISSDALEVIEDRDEAVCGWTSETGAVSETDSPEVGRRHIPLHELYAQPKATQRLIDDSAIDIEQWLAEKVADSFARKENKAFIDGDGVGKPRGILSYDAGTDWGEIEQVNSGTDGQVTADGIVKLYYSLKESYAARATFLMHRNALQQIRLLKETTTGQYLWQPGIAAGQPDTILGTPVMNAVDMPTPSNDSLSVAVGDFQAAYQVVDRQGVRILRDPFTEKPYVKFYATKRVGGDVVNFEAIKLLKLTS